MKIIRKEVPKEFLKTLPEGMKFIIKDGKEFLIIEELYCPKGHSLMDNTVRIQGQSAIRLKVRAGSSEGTIFLDATWGRHTKLYSFIPESSSAMEMLEAYCSVCGENLIVDHDCNDEKCDSTKSIQMMLPQKDNRIVACAKFGCPGHSIEIKEMREKTVRKVSKINYFGIGFDDDDLFKGV
jgi:hypothetical protein